jgi:hypothetical protein
MRPTEQKRDIVTTSQTSQCQVESEETATNERQESQAHSMIPSDITYIVLLTALSRGPP